MKTITTIDYTTFTLIKHSQCKRKNGYGTCYQKTPKHFRHHLKIINIIYIYTMSSSSYILNQRINNILSTINKQNDDGNESLSQSVSLSSDLQANSFNIVNSSVISAGIIETRQIDSAEDSIPVQILADLEFLDENSINSCSKISSSGYRGNDVVLTNMFVSSGIQDGEGSTYQWGQNFQPFTPLFPDSWGITLRNLNVSTTSNSLIALRIIPTSNSTICSYIRRELNSLADPIFVDGSSLIRLHTNKFKTNSSLTVKIEGCRPFIDSMKQRRGKTQFNIRIFGTESGEEKPVYNEIVCFLKNERLSTETEYSIEIFSMGQWGQPGGEAWIYENGFF
jgi:hypothetical protein